LVEKLGVKESQIFSVATFYKTISLEPRGKYIVNVCTGTACHVRGAEKIMDALENRLEVTEGQTTGDGRFTLEAVRCIGCCASGPVITVNQDTHGGLDRSSVLKVIEDYGQQAS
jgi:NADH:ubiquinone oxidoreductase subunit E